MISKSQLTSVISKYYLNGLNNQVKWRIKDKQLTIYAGEAGRVCKVVLNNFQIEDAEIGVFDTNKRTIALTSEKHPSIKMKLLDYLEFYQP